MPSSLEDLKQNFQTLLEEIKNFQEIARYIVAPPGEIPELPGIDVYGRTIPLNGLIGGDHITYVDFNRRYDLDERIRKAQEAGQREVARQLRLNKHRAGLLVADVSGHRITDALLNAMLHQAFLLGAIYELELYGHITTTLFENINTRFYRSSGIDKYLTMVYGEIAESGIFRFISAGHPYPIVFSLRYDRLVDLARAKFTSFPPIGFMPSQEDVDIKQTESPIGYKEGYELNEINLMGRGDILLVYTDGLSDHRRDDERYFPHHLERKLRQLKHLTAREIWDGIYEDMSGFGPPTDDVTFVVIKRL